MSPKKIVVVLGMHRSGTSALTRGLQVLGATLGDNLMPPVQENNEKGFWEDLDIYRLNELLLKKAGSAWHYMGPLEIAGFTSDTYAAERRDASKLLAEKLAITDVFAFKDPRTAILLPFWQAVFDDIGANVCYVIAIRNPLEIATSLQRRDGIDLTKGLMLWAKYTFNAVQYTNDMKRIFVSFENLLENPSRELTRIAHSMELPAPDPLKTSFKDYAREFLDQKFRHNVYSRAEMAASTHGLTFLSRLYELAIDWSALPEGGPSRPDENVWCDLIAQFDEDAPLLACIDTIEEQRGEAIKLNDRLEKDSATLTNENAVLAKDNATLTNENAALANDVNALKDEKSTLKTKLHATCDNLDAMTQKNRELVREIDARSSTLTELEVAHGRNARELQIVQKMLVQSEENLLVAYNQIDAVLLSTSWRITAPLRGTKSFLKNPIMGVRVVLSVCVRRISRRIPLPPRAKSALVDAAFSVFPFVFGWSATYKAWRQAKDIEKKKRTRASSLANAATLDGYTPLRAQTAPFRLEARAIAFYLPQFHTIPENDEWWGKGFTEWTNVRRASPQFPGHCQPRTPGELGYYDLVKNPNIRRRQVELAMLHGVSGFCFYFYWFAGKRLLEQPILDFADDPEINFPYCLCWANENWGRHWDGLDDEILIAQDHSASDDINFISHISRFLKNENYIRIDGKPLLIVYRPALLPDALETSERWRDWCRRKDIGEIYLAYTQSFETVDPAEIGFDAAIEFPPNNSGLVEKSRRSATPSPEFSGKIYDWTDLHKKSYAYRIPSYALFRGINPRWDNTPRRLSHATVLTGASPELYCDWLANAAEETKQRFSNWDERLIFINAWNEWAEGAYLEPDKRDGYAWLEATRRALNPNERKIIVAIHDLHKHGAQYLALNMAQTLKARFGHDVTIIAGEDGLLREAFSKLGPVLIVNKDTAYETIKKLSDDGYANAIVNSSAAGWLSPHLNRADIHFIGLVHELPSVVEVMDLAGNLIEMDRYAQQVVFPSRRVSNQDSAAIGIKWRRPTILPQGLYKRDGIAKIKEKEKARNSVIACLRLPEDARIMLGAGYGDHRKGIDIFIRWGLALASASPNAHAVWIGNIDAAMKAKCDELLAEAGAAARNIHFPGFVDDTGVFYAAADLYALSSREDPFPSTALEALSAGAPVIMIAGAGGIEDITERECVIALDTLEPDGFVYEALALIGSASRKRSRLGLIGSNFVRAEFGFASYMGDLLRMVGAPCPRVSVVVPNYNYATHIAQRLRSILDQTLPPWEIIFLDDASSDNSIEIAESVLSESDIRYRIIRNDKNSGSVFSQWRKGANLARSELIWIAEADDWADPAFLDATATPLAADEQLAISYTQSNQANIQGIVTCPDYLDYVADVNPDRWQRGYRCDGCEEIQKGMSVKNTIPNVSAAVFRGETLRRVLNEKFEEISQYRVAGDWMTYVNMLRYGGVVFDARSLNYHRRHDNSVTISRFGLEEFAEIAQMQAYVAQEFGIDEPVRQTARAYLDHLAQEYGLADDFGAEAVAKAMAS